jgi:UDP-N-acetylmuramyl pentapeptide phosphotransferase/UDP-N-acetylglucosamine-1-phosphate transferase
MVPPLIIGFLTSAVSTPIVLLAARRGGLLDRPNQRSLHHSTTPRGGGLAILAGIAAALALRRGDWAETPPVMALLAGAAMVALVGLLDDRFRLGILPRLVCQLAAALVLVSSTGGLARLPLPPPLDLPLGALGGALAVLWVVAVVNFVNFMDGIDGLASAQGLVTGLGLALLGMGSSATFLASALAGGCAGFLLFNWAPARMFLGDVGSGLVGYTLAAIPLLASGERGAAAVLFAGTSLLLFLADATVCLVSRLARGERWYEAHRQHLYQRWVAAGASHARVASRIVLASVATTVVALLAWRAGTPSWAWTGLALGAFLFALEWRGVVRAETQRMPTR